MHIRTKGIHKAIFTHLESIQLQPNKLFYSTPPQTSKKPLSVIAGYKFYSPETSMTPAMQKMAARLEEDRSIEEMMDELTPLEAACTEVFEAAAMSLGAISGEMQKTINESFNRMSMHNNGVTSIDELNKIPHPRGPFSNSGEGGSLKEWDGTVWDSQIKQIGTARWGVNIRFLAKAKIINIKISQSAKPGKGGQVPPIKVTAIIAKTRFTEEQIPLVSPSLHNNINSIEDLKQFIDDLHEINPNAEIVVKIVGTYNIEVIVVGVTKCGADWVEIAGLGGGTGATPVSARHDAAHPWPGSLAASHQKLKMEGLREKVGLCVSGGIQTGRDALIAILLGANRVSLGTSLLVAGGCNKQDRCHTNECSTGIATQDQDIIDEKFKGKPEHIARYIIGLAKSLAADLKYLGFAHPKDAVGHTEKLRVIKNAKVKGVEKLLFQPSNPYSAFTIPIQKKQPTYLNQSLIYRIQQGETNIQLKATNQIHAFGGYIANNTVTNPEFMKAFTKPVTVTFNGLSLGQSAGYFLPHNMVVVVPHTNDQTFISGDGGKIYTITAGKESCFGATEGRFYARYSGERTGIRNSGAFIVVEWTGYNFLNYMTRGGAMILGDPACYSELELKSEYKPPVLLRNEVFGPNFGASWTGGVCFMPKRLYQTKLEQGYFADSAKLIKPQSLSEKDVDTIIEELKSFALHLHSPIVEALLALDEKSLRSAIHREFIKLDPKVKLDHKAKQEVIPQTQISDSVIETVEPNKNETIGEVFELLPEGQTNPLPASGMTSSEKEMDACGVSVLVNLKSVASREMVEKVLKSLERLEHRGASGIDPQTGDGCGIWFKIDEEFFQIKFPDLNLKKENFGIMHIALPKDKAELDRAMQFFNDELKRAELEIAGVRDVPVNSDAMGVLGRKHEPVHQQFVIKKPENMDIEIFEKKLIKIQLRFECLVQKEKFEIPPHIISASAYHVIYKTMAKESQFANYFLDMKDPAFKISVAKAHARFATNALAAKERIQPYNNFAHNGEINSVQLFAKRMSKDPQYKKLLDLESIDFNGWSDSRIVSFYMNLLYLAGKNPEKIIASMIQGYLPKNPQASTVNNLFYLPAEGPMSGVISFGNYFYVVKCKAGLRPLQGIVNDELLYCGSELGPVEMEGEILSPPPGQVFMINLKTKQYGMYQISAADQTYYENQLKHFKKLSTNFSNPEPIQFGEEEFALRKLRAGWTEDVDRIFIQPYFNNGKGLMVSMGDEGPPLVYEELAEKIKMDFRQITAPTIPKTEEKKFMSTDVFVGKKPDPASNDNTLVDGWHLSSPFVNNHQMEELKNDPALNAKTIDIIFPVKDREKGMEKAIKKICRLCVNLVLEKEVSLIVLSDLKINDDYAVIPPVLVTAMVNDALLKAGVREKVSIAVQAGSLLRGVDIAQVITVGGADILNPYLPLIGAKERGQGFLESLDDELLDFMAKAGIYTASGYRETGCANAFGLDQALVDLLGIPTTFEGTGINEITTMVLNQHNSPKPQGSGRFEGQESGPRKGIWNAANTLGLTKFARGKDKDFAALEKKMNSVRSGTLQGQFEIKPSQHWNDKNPMTIPIIGGGLAAFCHAKYLLDTGLPFKIVMLEQNLANRMGLIGDGVAPDHGGTKKTAYKMFRKMVADNPAFQYYGGVTVGDKKGTGNVDLQTLQSIYPVVIDCRGANKDRQFPAKVKGADLTIPASAAFKPYNNAFNFKGDKKSPAYFSNSINREIGVIGGGNVALDIIRIFLKNPKELEKTNISPEFLDMLKTDAPAVIHVFIREMPFDVLMNLNGLEQLEKLGIFISADFDDSKIKVDDLNKEQKELYDFFVKYKNREKPKTDGNIKQLHFHFDCNAKLFAVKGNEFEGQFVKSDKSELTIRARAFIRAIGFDILANNNPDILQGGWKEGKGGNIQATEVSAAKNTKIIVKKFLNGEYHDIMDPPPELPEFLAQAPIGNQEFLNTLDWLEQGNQIKTGKDLWEARRFKPEPQPVNITQENKPPAPVMKDTVAMAEPESDPDKVTVMDKNGKKIGIFDTENNESILRSLQKKGIELDHDCNGVKVCGQCAVKIEKKPGNLQQDEREVNVLEANMEPGQDSKNYALACAHTMFAFKGAAIKVLKEQKENQSTVKMGFSRE